MKKELLGAYTSGLMARKKGVKVGDNPYDEEMEFDSDHIEGAFIHGDDDFAIRYVGESIGREAAQLIRRANYHRWETAGGRRQEHYSNADYNQYNGEQYR